MLGIQQVLRARLTSSSAAAKSRARLAVSRFAFARASRLLRTLDETTDSDPELLELRIICTSRSAMCGNVAVSARAAGVLLSILVGGSVTVAELEEAPLELRDCPAALGAE